MINAGAMILSALIKPRDTITERTNFVSVLATNLIYPLQLPPSPPNSLFSSPPLLLFLSPPPSSLLPSSSFLLPLLPSSLLPPFLPSLLLPLLHLPLFNPLPSHPLPSQILQKFCEMAGVPDRSMKCDVMTCDSEMETAYRNYALLYYMKDMGVR